MLFGSPQRGRFQSGRRRHIFADGTEEVTDKTVGVQFDRPIFPLERQTRNTSLAAFPDFWNGSGPCSFS